MTRVVDASALVAALIDEGPEGRWARTQIALGTLNIPEIALAEATNTLRRLERAGRLPRPEAFSAQRQLLRLALDTFPFRPFAERIWELRDNLTSYDAWYVAIAEALDCPLLTLDVRLSRSPGPMCAFITPPTESD